MNVHVRSVQMSSATYAGPWPRRQIALWPARTILLHLALEIARALTRLTTVSIDASRHPRAVRAFARNRQSHLASSPAKYFATASYPRAPPTLGPGPERARIEQMRVSRLPVGLAVRNSSSVFCVPIKSSRRTRAARTNNKAGCGMDADGGASSSFAAAKNRRGAINSSAKPALASRNQPALPV